MAAVKSPYFKLSCYHFYEADSEFDDYEPEYEGDEEWEEGYAIT
jgi:hypothetical protein